MKTYLIMKYIMYVYLVARFYENYLMHVYYKYNKNIIYEIY